MYLANRARTVLIPFLLAVTLQGCGGEEEAETPAPTVADLEADFDTTLEGSVGDGPVAGARIVVRGRDGTVLQDAVASQLAGYNVTLKAKGKYFPLVLDATGGTDLVTNLTPDFVLRSSALEPRKRVTVNLNPFTTLAIATAEQMGGGATSSNIKNALSTTTAQFNSGLTTLAAGGVMDATIGVSNLPEIVKSSETLAEILRRVDSIRRASGRTSSVDDVVRVIGADLVDGSLDGRGAMRTDAHASAAAVLVSAQVIVESMTNTLHVNGQPVTTALDDVINRLGSTTLAAPTATVPISAAMIDAARKGTAAAIAIVPSPALTALQQSLSSLTPGMLPPAVAQALPSGASSAFAPALTQIIAGATTDVAAINTTSAVGAVPSNQPPTISGTPPTTVTAGTAYSFTPMASDPDGNALTFAITNRPAWASFNSSTGRLAGTPAAANVGTFSNITVSVSDGLTNTSLPPFTVAVTAAPNQPPTISGTPATSVLQGTLYSFQPTAADPDGDSLTFSVANKPAWLTLNAGTGRLSGTAGPGDVGTTASMVISVSDGMASTPLAGFSISVQAVASGSATLSWQPPTTNTDGTPLTDLAGYKVYWGTTAGSLTSSATINNPGIATYIVESLTPNTYYFAVTALNSAGVESVLSNSASKTIQ